MVIPQACLFPFKDGMSAKTDGLGTKFTVELKSD
jgi:hypothetical protein